MNNELELIIPAEAKKAASDLSVPENRALELFKPLAEPFKVALADTVVATPMPTVSTPEAQAIVEEFQSMLQRARAWIIKKTEAM